MEVIEISINLEGIKDHVIDLLPFRLGENDYEGFFETSSLLLAYISKDKFNRNLLNKQLEELGISEESYVISLVPDRNWNEVWESNFQPVKIGNCFIRAPFHKPDESAGIEIIIEPKMSFGTGHHATTTLMITEMLSDDFSDKKVLDAGSGTGILSILAEKLGASEITAIDNDEWSYRNAGENSIRNNCSRIRLMHGDLGEVNGQQFDIILANINLNVHRANLMNYYAVCKTNGSLLVSGILSSDIQPLKIEAMNLGFAFVSSCLRDNWAIIRFTKK